MQFSTPIHIPLSPWSIGYGDSILMLGSCFSDNIAAKLKEYYFHVTANPFGTLYNPLSIVHHITPDLMEKADVIIITFGTAWVYEDKHGVVDNCQKRPASDFTRRRLSIEEITEIWREVVENYANKRFVFTVSPIRHLKDGLHANNLSKATLHLALDQLISEGRGNVMYFPSYEILMDELRDYRYYAEDMMHPSKVAVDYIFEQFEHTFLYDSETRKAMAELHQLWTDEQHRPLHPESDEYHQFRAALMERKAELVKKYNL